MASITIPVNELNEFDLPRVCVVTGQRENVVFKDVKFSWYPRWIAALVIFNLLIAAVVAMALTKKAKGKLPFTEEGYRMWKQGNLFFGLSLVGAFLLFVGAMVGFGNDVPALGLVGLVASIALPVTVWIVFARKARLTATRIDDKAITLTIPSGEAGFLIEQHLHGGGVGLNPVAAALPAS